MMLPRLDSCAYAPNKLDLLLVHNKMAVRVPVPHILVLHKARVAGATCQDKTVAARLHTNVPR